MTKFICTSGFTLKAYRKPCPHCGATYKQPCRKPPKKVPDILSDKRRSR